MAGPDTHAHGAAGGSPRRHEGRFLAWVIVLALGFALFTLYDYNRTGSFGRSYFVGAFFVLGTLLLITFFLALRPMTEPPAPVQSAARARSSPASNASAAPSTDGSAESRSTVPRTDSLGARVQVAKDTTSGTASPAPPGIRFLRRRVAYDAPNARVVKSEYDVNGMLVRDYDVVTDDETYPFRRIERRLDRLRLEPVPSMGGRGAGQAADWDSPSGGPR